MRPSLDHDQTVMLLPVDKALVVGHIYVFLYFGKLLMHRLVAVRKHRAIFMGDHSTRMEEVDRSAIVAALECKYTRVALPLINLLNRLCCYASEFRFLFAVLQKVRVHSLLLIAGMKIRERNIRKARDHHT
jgi:hypothetical protein